MALPREVPPDQYAAMVREYCQEHFVSKGMICDFAIHDKGDGTHVHILLTLRSPMNRTLCPKCRKEYVLRWSKDLLPSGDGKVAVLISMIGTTKVTAKCGDTDGKSLEPIP